MKRFSIVGIAEKRVGATNYIEVVHNVDCYANSIDEARGMVQRHFQDNMPDYAVQKIDVLEILPRDIQA